MEEKVFFLGEGSGLGLDPELQGYGFKIPGRTIDFYILTEHRTNF
jgi:hypothetical protein